MLHNKKLEEKQFDELHKLTQEHLKAKDAYQKLYDKYYHAGQQITNDQRAEVRKAFTAYDKNYGEQKLKEMVARHQREREEYNAEAYQRWTQLEAKREDLIKEYGSITNIPKEVMDKYKEEKRQYDVEWGENGNQLKDMLKEQNTARSEEEKKRDKIFYDRTLSPYQKTIRKHMEERIEFNGKVADNWRQHEIYRDDLVKEYNGWQNVPPYQKELFKQRKDEFEKEWGDDGKQKQSMSKRHHEEIATQIRLETEKHRDPQKDREKEKE